MAAEPAAPNPAVDGNSTFAFELYAQLRQSEKGNLFFSPASIHAALAMTYAGAKAETAAQMANVLHYPEDRKALAAAYGTLLKTLNNAPLDWDKKPAYALSIVNALWGQKGYPFVADFLTLNKEHFGAGLNEVDFAQSESARKTINDWVAQKTKDRIKDLIPQGVLDDLTRLVLTNAVYFKSRWAEEFREEATQDGPFTRLDGKPVTVPLMCRQDGYSYGENDQVQILELPYNRHALNMVIVLPKKAAGLPDVEKDLDAKRVGQWLAGLKGVEVLVTVPRFKIEGSFSLADALKAMGLTDAFVFKKANFTGVATVEDLYISAILHKSFVEVDEKGTEAAAATAVVMAAGAAPGEPEKPRIFKADHPFLFLIRHRATGEILFLGRLMDPVGK
jgi:serpin B